MEAKRAEEKTQWLKALVAQSLGPEFRSQGTWNKLDIQKTHITPGLKNLDPLLVSEYTHKYMF